MLHIIETIADHAIIQCDAPLIIRGTGPAGHYTVHVATADGETSNTFHHQGGHFSWEMPSHPAHTVIDLFIHDACDQILFQASRIIAGDLFVLAGQSNMQLTVERTVLHMPKEYATLDCPNIRQLCLPVAPSFDPENTLWPSPVAWETLTPYTLHGFSALGVGFAIKEHLRTKRPIGLITVAVGGTPIESWLPFEQLTQTQDDILIDQTKTYQTNAARHTLERQEAATQTQWHNQVWSQEPIDSHASISLPKPTMFKEAPYNFGAGRVQIHATFKLTTKEADCFNRFAAPLNSEDPLAICKGLRIDLGQMIDHDRTRLNDHLIGETHYRYPPRRYMITAPDILKPGTNQLTIDLVINGQHGGLVPDMPYRITCPKCTIDLQSRADWSVTPCTSVSPAPVTTRWDTFAGVNYYAYIQPIESLPIRAIFWYQGESNDADPTHYGAHFETLIRHYQTHFQRSPQFLYISLPEFNDPTESIPDGAWDIIRDAQINAQSIPNTIHVPALGLGETNDLHPENKWALADRIHTAWLDANA